MVEGGVAFALLHEENSGRVEKGCFAGNGFLVLLLCSVADAHRRRYPKPEYFQMLSQLAARSALSMGPSVEQSTPAKMNSIVSRPASIFAMWCARSAERTALRELAQEPQLLNDIGLTREQALREATKLFWPP
jgi:uncharacterized protein YjiS (DUF1127 family)